MAAPGTHEHVNELLQRYVRKALKEALASIFPVNSKLRQSRDIHS